MPEPQPDRPPATASAALALPDARPLPPRAPGRRRAAPPAPAPAPARPGRASLLLARGAWLLTCLAIPAWALAPAAGVFLSAGFLAAGLAIGLWVQRRCCGEDLALPPASP